MNTPPPLPPSAPHEAGSEDADATTKVALNFWAALGYTTLALWLVVADLGYPGDLLFQSSLSLPFLALYLGTLATVALVLAIFPKRIVLGANLLLILRGAVGYPFNAWMENSRAAIILSFALLALALFYLACVARKRMRIDRRPWLRLSHSLTLLGAGVCLTLLALPVTLTGYSHATQNLIGDYVRVSPMSISLVERVFRKGDQKIFLVGMMHIGEGSFYDDLEKRLVTAVEGEGKRLVLTEGVSDREKVLPESFASGATYARWATLLGLEQQRDIAGPATKKKDAVAERRKNSRQKGIHFENADIDIADLDPGHRETLVILLEFLGTSEPAELLVTSPQGVTGIDIEDLFIDGLIGRRNSALIQRLRELGSDYAEVYIPWGAAHLGDVEKRLLDMGYEEIDEIVRPIVSFWN